MALTQADLNRILNSQSAVQRAFEANQPTVTNTPRSMVSGTWADILKPIVSNPVGEFVGAADMQRALDSASYGKPLTTGGSVQTGGFRPEYLAAALGLTPIGKGKKAKTAFEDAFDLAQRNATLPVNKGGLGLPATNTAMDRAKAMGYTTPAYTGANISDEVTSMLPKSWFSKEPEYSSKYSTVIPADGISKEPRMYPVLLNTGKTEVSPMFGLYEDMEKALSKKKINTFKVEGVGGGTNDFYVPKESNQSRSIFAAFDPFRRNEPDMLAGVAAAPAGLLTIDESKKKKTTKK